MNKENKCALCTHRSAHNGSCLIQNCLIQDCKFRPNGYAELFEEELQKIKAEFKELQKAHHIWLIDQDILIDECSEIIDKHISEISELKGE